VFRSVQSRCLTSITSVLQLKFCLYHVYNLRYMLFHIYFRFDAAIFDFTPTLTSSFTLLYSSHYVVRCKDMRIPFKFKSYTFTMSGLIVSGFTSTILFPVELCTGRCCYQQWWLRHSQKQTQKFAYRWFTPFDSMVTKFNYHIFTNKSCTPPSLPVT